MSERQQKQKFFRQNILEDQQEDFYQFLVNQNIQADIDGWTLDYIKKLVSRFKAAKAKQQKQQSHQRSFANYQTANLQQAYSIVAAMNNNQQNKPSKPGQTSATDLLDSVFQASQTQRDVQNLSPTRSPTDKKIQQKKFASNVNVPGFQNGNIWATTSNVTAQRKSAQFDNFWQFPTTVNNNKPQAQQFATQKPAFFGGKQQNNQSSNQNLYSKPFSNQSKNSYSPQVYNKAISFDELTKKVNMSKKTTPYVAQNVQKPSSMKRQQSNIANYSSGGNQKNNNQTQNYTSNKPVQQPNYGTQSNQNQNNKQIKLISQKPLTQQQLSSSNVNNQMMSTNKNLNFQSNNIKVPLSNLATAYKNNKVPYQGPAVHKHEWIQTIKCYQAPKRQLIDKQIDISIQKHQIVQRNFFVKDYVMYFLTVKPLNRVCKRNYQDFTKLRSALEKFYPGMQFPYLEKNTFFQTSQENIKKQKHMLQFFLRDLCTNPQVRNSRIFEDFITFPDHKTIKRKFEEYAKMDQYKSIQELCIVDGKVDAVINQPQRIYHQQLSKFLQMMQDLMGKKSRLMDTLGQQYTQVHETLCNLAKLSAQIRQQCKKFNQRVTDYEFPSLENTFNIITKSYQQWAVRASFESKVITKRLSPFYTYQKNNLQTMRNLVNIESSFFRTYMKRAGNQTSGTNDYNTYTAQTTKQFKNGILDPSSNNTVLKYQLGYLGNLLCKQTSRFFELMAVNFRDKWIYKAEKYNQRLNKDVQFYRSLAVMVK